MEKSEIVKAIKEDLDWATKDGFAQNVGYKLLDDGNLCVQTFGDSGAVSKTYLVNISIGRELDKSEWSV